MLEAARVCPSDRVRRAAIGIAREIPDFRAFAGQFALERSMGVLYSLRRW
jgi:hypothetical protein